MEKLSASIMSGKIKRDEKFFGRRKLF